MNFRTGTTRDSLSQCRYQVVDTVWKPTEAVMSWAGSVRRDVKRWQTAALTADSNRKRYRLSVIKCVLDGRVVTGRLRRPRRKDVLSPRMASTCQLSRKPTPNVAYDRKLLGTDAPLMEYRRACATIWRWVTCTQDWQKRGCYVTLRYVTILYDEMN